MAVLNDYFCPTTIEDALRLLSAPERRLLPLAGGTQLIGLLETRRLTDVDGVVDLRNLGLAAIRTDGDWLRIGAMATLADLVAYPGAAELADGLLLKAARGEGPVNLQNVATMGGVIACAEYDSEFYAALLALDAEVVLRDAGGETSVALAALQNVTGLVTKVQLPLRACMGGYARVARTPADRPIVAALAVRSEAGTRLALVGVGPRPVLDGTPLDPPDDHKGSAAYRQAMAAVVGRRALEQLDVRH